MRKRRFWNENVKVKTILRFFLKFRALLRLPSLPKKIEGFDISNTQGMHSYGSHVVFVDGERDRSQYRLYKIKTVTKDRMTLRASRKCWSAV
jgi:excinuclease UvrABC nuclease subunit